MLKGWPYGRCVSRAMCPSVTPEEGHLLSICFLQSSSGSERWPTRGCFCWALYHQRSWNRQTRQILRDLLLSLNTLSSSPQQRRRVQGVIAPAVMMISFTWGLKLPTAVSAGSSGGKSGAIKASVDKACRSGSYKDVWSYFVGAWLLSITIRALDENSLSFFFFTSKDLTSTGWDYF